MGVLTSDRIGGVLYSFRERQALPALTKALKDSDEDVRVAAAGAVARLDPKNQDALPVIIAGLKDPDGPVRYRAVRVLEEIGSPAKAAVPALIYVFTADREKDVREWAGRALRKIDPEAAMKAGVK
jgi:HEAT repeat protein